MHCNNVNELKKLISFYDCDHLLLSKSYEKTSGELNFYRGESTCSVTKQFGRNVLEAKRTFTKERLWANLRNGRSCIPGYGKPSDFFTLTGFVNIRALLKQTRKAIW